MEEGSPTIGEGYDKLRASSVQSGKAQLTWASRAAPITEPQNASITAVSPAEAQRIAQGQGRARRKSRNGIPASEPVVTELPPVRQAPMRIAPVMLFLSQTVVDMVAIAGAFSFAYWLRFQSDILVKFVEPDAQVYAAMLGVTVATIVITFYFSKLYNLKRGASRVDEFYRIAGAVSMGTVLSLATNSLLLGDRFVYSRQLLLIGWVLAILFVTVGRLLYSVALGELRKRGVDRARVLVVGAGPTAAMVIQRLKEHRTLGYEVVGAVEASQTGAAPSGTVAGAPVLGDLSKLRALVRKQRADEVLVALTGASDQDLRDILERIQDETVSVKIYPDAFQLITESEVSVGELSGLPLLSVKDVALRGWNRVLKRAFDVVFSALLLVLTAPLMLVIALAIKLSSSGPVFFIQERVGLDNKPFQLVKFRTMRVEPESGMEAGEENGNGSDKADWTVPEDPRRTSLGTFLRRFSLDELPQFYNVLIGEMSVVGPRPEQPKYVEEFAQVIPQYLRRHKEKAGITGWAQVNDMRGHTPIGERTYYDLYYVENWSLLFDLKIIARTVFTMLRGKNAY
jgi:exopolysaccharide biosynthesis polyprenyl glycosylphosphotransferase